LILSEKFYNSTQGNWVVKNAEKLNINVFLTDEPGMNSLSEDVTPPGIVFIVEQKPITNISINDICENTILYLEEISDPGNLGTILRSACWFGIKSILLSPECVDPWNSKSIRASAGAIFETNIYTDVEYSLLTRQFKKKQYTFVATVVSEGIALDKWKVASKNILLFGQEASGLSKEILKDADVHIIIPGYGNIESLNLSVAASIILYETTKSNKDI
jgi:TrmH family RNA methyltransferase